MFFKSVNNKANLTFHEWLQVGMDNHWCGPAVCETHDGLPLSEQEETWFFDEGIDPCIHIVRLYESLDHKMHVEVNHTPSQWRKL